MTAATSSRSSSCGVTTNNHGSTSATCTRSLTNSVADTDRPASLATSRPQAAFDRRNGFRVRSRRAVARARSSLCIPGRPRRCAPRGPGCATTISSGNATEHARCHPAQRRRLPDSVANGQRLFPRTMRRSFASTTKISVDTTLEMHEELGDRFDVEWPVEASRFDRNASSIFMPTPVPTAATMASAAAGPAPLSTTLANCTMRARRRTRGRTHPFRRLRRGSAVSIPPPWAPGRCSRWEAARRAGSW